jgi:arylsulfatase A-like enzyme
MWTAPRAIAQLPFLPSFDRASPWPDIVLILTDDQRWDTIDRLGCGWPMPIVKSRLIDRGVRFTSAFVQNPVCCASRATMLTGRPSHATGIWNNDPPVGGYEMFHDGSTIATSLQSSGYRTGLFGKYLNGYGPAAHRGERPPGWDRWVALAEGNSKYEDYDLLVDDHIRTYHETPDDYSTSVFTDYAVSFIHRSRGPLFLVLSLAAPHNPHLPARGDEEAFGGLRPWRPPSFGEADVSDKPAYIRTREWTRRDAGQAQLTRRHQYRTLLAVDRCVGRMLDALADTGRLSNSLIVYTGDNGLCWGEHRLNGKCAPYEESIRVPLVIRSDRLTGGGRSEHRFALNVDLAETFAEAADISFESGSGSSLLPLVGGTAGPWRDRFLIEHALNPVDDRTATYCGVRTTRWKYVLYADGFQELYDLQRDPYELRNVVHRWDLRGLVRDLRAWALAKCRPRPPG